MHRIRTYQTEGAPALNRFSKKKKTEDKRRRQKN